MPKLVKDKQISPSNDWKILEDAAAIGDIPDSGRFALPPTLFTEIRPKNTGERELGLVIPGDIDLQTISELVSGTGFIAIKFPAFTDGRGFSCARMLREQFEFDGELRAIGDFMLDQLFYLMRCGFNSFEVADEHSDADITECLNAFSETYQAAVDDPQPLFRRRA